MGTFTSELIFGEYAYGTMTETPNISYKTLLYNGFSPLSLFAASEPGFWYDPSDISTLFQDATGTTPVTAAGQSVGLVLDKSKGLVLGPELFANQPSALDNSGGGATVTHTPATRTVQVTSAGTNTGYPRLQIEIGATTGRRYVVSGQIDGNRSNVGFVRLAAAGALNNLVYSPTTGVFSGIQEAGASPILEVLINGTLTGTVTLTTFSIRELPGNHATQSTSLSRPTYQVDSDGRGYLSFDGSDDFLITPTITPGTDKAQVFAGVRKLSDVATGTVVELSASGSDGSIGVFAPLSAAANYEWRSRGTSVAQATSGNTFAAPITNVLTGIGEISTDTAILRVNGTQVATSAVDQGTGNYLAYPAYIGRRGGTTLPFNGHIYSLICRFGPNLTADQITQTEAWVNSKTGAY